jgi:hypothetical protein
MMEIDDLSGFLGEHKKRVLRVARLDEQVRRINERLEALDVEFRLNCQLLMDDVNAVDKRCELKAEHERLLKERWLNNYSNVVNCPGCGEETQYVFLKIHHNCC